MEPMVGRRIGKYLQAVELVEDTNFMSGVTNRYRYRLVVDETVRAECELFKRLAYDVVFMSPELNQLEYKGNYMLERLWGLLVQRYLSGEVSGYALLPEGIARELEECEEVDEKRRLLCDYMASLTDGGMGRLYKRLFVPDFGSIGDLV